MNRRSLLLLVCGASVASIFAWQLWGPQEPVAPATSAASAPVSQPGQPRWFSSLPPSSASWPDPRAAPRQDNAVFGRNGRAVNLGGKSVSQYIDARVVAARSGDIQAAYDVYQAASICAATEDPVSEYYDPAERDAFLRERAGLIKLCAGMSSAQVQERMRFLGTAARAGHLNALVDFYMEGPYGRDVDISQHPDDPTVKQWKTDAMTYLQAAGARCDQFALALLSTVYDAGQLTGRDMGKSMAYSIAADVSRNKAQTEEQLRERFGAELTAEQFAAARQLGAQLGQAACPKR